MTTKDLSSLVAEANKIPKLRQELDAAHRAALNHQELLRKAREEGETKAAELDRRKLEVGHQLSDAERALEQLRFKVVGADLLKQRDRALTAANKAERAHRDALAVEANARRALAMALAEGEYKTVRRGGKTFKRVKDRERADMIKRQLAEAEGPHKKIAEEFERTKAELKKLDTQIDKLVEKALKSR